MPEPIAGVEERARHAVEGVAVDAVGADRLHDRRQAVPVRATGVAGAVIPGLGRQEHLDPAPVEGIDRALEAVEAAGQVMRQVELVAVVDADVGVDVPDQHRIEATEAPLEIVEVAIDRVLARPDVEEVTVLDHHLRVHEVALRPLQFRAPVVGVVVTDAHQVFAAPVPQFGQPVGGAFVGVDHPLADVGERPARRLARRGQVAAGGDVRELVLAAQRRRAVVGVGGIGFGDVVGGGHGVIES